MTALLESPTQTLAEAVITASHWVVEARPVIVAYQQIHSNGEF